MNNNLWKSAGFVVKTSLRYFPRLLIAPFVGGYRDFSETMDRMDAEIRAYEANQNQPAERNPTRSFNA
jgi:hypothetical protein